MLRRRWRRCWLPGSRRPRPPSRPPARFPVGGPALGERSNFPNEQGWRGSRHGAKRRPLLPLLVPEAACDNGAPGPGHAAVDRAFVTLATDADCRVGLPVLIEAHTQVSLCRHRPLGHDRSGPVGGEAGSTCFAAVKQHRLQRRTVGADTGCERHGSHRPDLMHAALYRSIL
jgi:hypothetical protein